MENENKDNGRESLFIIIIGIIWYSLISGRVLSWALVGIGVYFVLGFADVLTGIHPNNSWLLHTGLLTFAGVGTLIGFLDLPFSLLRDNWDVKGFIKKHITRIK